MSDAALHDLGLRLRAWDEGTVQPRLTGTPYEPAARRLAIHVEAGELTVHPFGEAPTSAPLKSDDALRLLVAFLPSEPDDIDTGEHAPPTLILPDRSTLPALVNRVRKMERETANPLLWQVGAMVDWWTQRLSHPGTQSVLILADACRVRWVTGAYPTDESELSTWARWLGVEGDATNVCHAVYGKLTSGQVMEQFLPLAGDSGSWHRLRMDIDNQHDWNRPDSPKRAAIGAHTRSAVADTFNRLLLDDPLWRGRGVYSGDVIDGVVTHADMFVLTFRTNQSEVNTKAGKSGLLIDPSSDNSMSASKVNVRGYAFTNSSMLVTVEAQTSSADLSSRFTPGQKVMLTKDPAAPWLTAATSRILSEQYDRGSWVFRGDMSPAVVTRDVPGVVAMAAAMSEEVN